MPNMIYAAFATEQDAERAAGALIDRGVAVQDIRFIVPEGAATARGEWTAEERAAGEARVGGARVPTAAPPARTPADIPAPDVPEVTASPPMNKLAGTNGHPIFERDGMQTTSGYTFDTVADVIPDPEQEAMQAQTPATQVITPPAATPAVPSNAPLDVIEHERRSHSVDQDRIEPALSIHVTGAVPSGEILGLLQKYGATSAELF